jgi:hypothetical protein
LKYLKLVCQMNNHPAKAFLGHRASIKAKIRFQFRRQTKWPRKVANNLHSYNLHNSRLANSHQLKRANKMPRTKSLPFRIR